MACSNCFNNCVDPTSDKCVKYTGNDIPALGITNGDTLLTVENALTTYLLSALDGTGITLNITPGDICALVSGYLPDVNDIKAIDLFKALIQATCSLQQQINTEKARIDTIEANYTIDCLTGVSAGDGTHAIVQAIITKLCAVDVALTALSLDVDTNYVKLSDFNTLVQAYLNSIAITNKAYTKMVPYSPIPYIGATSNYPNVGDSFDISGAGQNYWEKVYLCNGLNGTPDMRGRSPIGAIVGMGGGALDPEVDPAVDPTFNPNYTVSGVNSKAGINKVTLTEVQIPAHTHTANSIVTDPGHDHAPAAGTDFAIWINNEANAGSGSSGYEVSATDHPTNTTTDTTGITVSTTISNTGGGQAHDNKMPVRACYYIIYIP